MTNHKYWLETGLPDLSESARHWLSSSNNYSESTVEVDPSDMSELFKSHFSRQLFGDSRNGMPGLSQSSHCRRKRAYQAFGAEAENLTGSSKMTFALGDTTEWFLVAAAINAGWDIESTIFSDGGQKEVELKLAGHTIKGHPDGLIFLGDTVVLVEIKSMKEWKFAHWSNNKCAFVDHITDDVFEYDPTDEDLSQFWGNNMAQIHAYMACLKEEYPDKDVRCLFWCLNKNSGWHRNAEVQWNDAIWAEVKEDWITTLEYIEAEELPPRPPEIKSKLSNGGKVLGFPCSYCKYFKTCHGENAVRTEEDNTGKLEVRLR